MSIAAKDVMDLRKRTGVSMMACKKALVEAEGDMDKAVELLRKRGEAKASEKADRGTTEGVVACSGRSLLALRCETDFVARNEAFMSAAQGIADTLDASGEEAANAQWEASRTELFTQMGENIQLTDLVQVEGGDTLGFYIHSNHKHGAIVALQGGTSELAKDVALHIVATSPLVMSPDEVDDTLLTAERDIWRDQLINEGKPEQIIDNIITGKESKFRSEKALLTQPFVKNPDQTIAQLVEAGGAQVIAFRHVTI